MKGFAATTACCLLLVASCLWGQETAPSLSWGPPYKAEGNSTLDKVVGFTPEDIFFLRVKQSGAFSNHDKIYMERYSRDLKLKHSEEIVLQYDKTDVQLEDVLFLNNQLFLLTSYANQSHEKVYLFMQKLSDKQMRPTGKAEKIVEGPFGETSTGVPSIFSFHPIVPTCSFTTRSPPMPGNRSALPCTCSTGTWRFSGNGKSCCHTPTSSLPSANTGSTGLERCI